jgi:hypothetical protein
MGGWCTPLRSVAALRARVRYLEPVRDFWPVAIVSVLAASCAPSKAEIKTEFDAVVERSNRCESSNQCVLIDLECPLGCRAAVPADRAQALLEQARVLIKDYESGGVVCAYDCAAPGTPMCEQGRCVEAPAVDGSGQTQACTELGCGFPFSVQFEKSGVWAPGHYRVRVTLDGRAVECAADFPLSCDAPPACDDPGIVLGLSGCALPAESHAIIGVDVLTETAAVSVELLAVSGSLASGTWSPTYTTTQPNGPQCAPVCRTAPSATLAIP